MTGVEPAREVAAKPKVGFCRDCKWWARPLSTFEDAYREGRCLLAATNWSYEKQPHPESMAKAVGEYGYPGLLRTPPDFGCVQFQEKGEG